MRSILWISLGFTAGCGLRIYFPGWEGWMQLGVILMVCGVVCLLLGRKQTVLKKLAIVCLGAVLGFGWYLGYREGYLSSAVTLDGVVCSARIRTSDFSYDTGYGMAADGIVALDKKQYAVRVYLKAGEELPPATEIDGNFRFRVTVPGGQEEATTHGSKGIFLLAYQQEEVTLDQREPSSLRERASVLRRAISRKLELFFPEDTMPFAKALLLGDTRFLSYKVDTDLKVSGIRHVAAVSGLHVSILFALISMAAMRKRLLTAALGFPALLLFAAVAGFTPSVTRACIMSALMLGALLFNREYDGPSALSFAVLVMVAANPYAVTSASLQLSVASVAGIFLVAPSVREWIASRLGNNKGKSITARLRRWLAASVSVSLGAVVLTTPLCAWYFGMVSLIGVVTNLLTLWVISFVFYGIIAVAFLGSLWPGMGVLLGKLVALPIRYVLLAADWMADIPLAAVYLENTYVIGWLVFVYMLLGVFLISRKKKPGELCCCACMGLCVTLMLCWYQPEGQVKITVLDVGQGQSILLQSEGKAFLVDCGGDSDTTAADIAAQALLSQGISSLDGMILTHLDRDHAGAAGNFLTRIPTRLLILPPVPTELSQAPVQTVVYGREDLEVGWGNTVLRVFSPEFPGKGNENCLCILFDTGKCDILITGDRNGFGERMLLRFHEIPDVDILMAGHHGAESSTCQELLAAVRPEIVCISVGQDNVYDHPSPKLLQRLADFGCTVYRTDQSGTITIRR